MTSAVSGAGRRVASAISVGVLIDEASRRPTPLTEEVVAKLRPWHKRGIVVAPPYI